MLCCAVQGRAACPSRYLYAAGANGQQALQLGTREEALAGAAIWLSRVGDLPVDPVAASPPPPLPQLRPPPPGLVPRPRPPPPRPAVRRSPPPFKPTIRRSPPPPKTAQRSPPPPTTAQGSPPPPVGLVAPKLTAVQALGPKTVQASASGAAASFKLWRFTARPVLGGQNVSLAVAVPQALLAGLKPATKARLVWVCELGTGALPCHPLLPLHRSLVRSKPQVCRLLFSLKLPPSPSIHPAAVRDFACVTDGRRPMAGGS